MTKSVQYKALAAGLVAFGLGFLLLQVLSDDKGTHGPDQLDRTDVSRGEGVTGGRLTADGARRGGPGEAGAQPGLEPGGSAGLQPGWRTPSGIDLSDPETRRSELARLLGAQEIDWRQVADLLAVMTEPIDPTLRVHFINGLRVGQRNMVMLAFEKLRDPSFTQDLFDILDDPEAARGAHAAALQALWRMPGADANDVALRLESRLTNDLGQDRELLYALAARGGQEAARAMVEYLQRVDRPEDVPPHILQTLNVKDDPEVSRIVVEALGRTQEPAVLTSLLALVGQPGASAFTSAVVGLDVEGRDPALREAIYRTLSQIGDEAAVDYLLRRADQPGQVGEQAVQAMGGVRSATPAARAKLADALARANESRHAEEMKASLLLALGALRHAEAVPAIASYLNDPSPKVQASAVRALGRVGASGRQQVSKLAALFGGGDEALRMNVVVALGSIGGQAAIDAMEAMLKEEKLSPSLDKTLRMGLRAAKDDLGKDG